MSALSRPDRWAIHPLSEEEIVFNCYILIIGGDETSRLAMIGALPALMEHPGQ